jgi:hypothetical protein
LIWRSRLGQDFGDFLEQISEDICEKKDTKDCPNLLMRNQTNVENTIFCPSLYLQKDSGPLRSFFKNPSLKLRSSPNSKELASSLIFKSEPLKKTSYAGIR